MRKLITILLIAFIASVEVETIAKKEESEVSDFNELLDLLDLDANSVELFKFKFFDWFKKFINGVKGFFGNLWNNVQKPIEMLKASGVWDQLYSLAKTGTKFAVVKLCSEYFAKDTCSTIVDGIFKMIDGKK